MYEALKSLLVDDLHLNEAAVQPGARREDAGLDSLATVELSMLLSQRLSIDISDDELLEVATVADIAHLMEERSAKG